MNNINNTNFIFKKIETYDIKSAQNIEHVHGVLKIMDAKNYDGKE